MARIVLVTGGTSGIGRATAARFVAEGDDVVITGRRADTVEKAAAELGGPGSCRGIACDATDPTQVADLAQRLGPVVDVVVNLAGGLATVDAAATASSPLEALHAQWRADLELNLLSTVLTTAAVRDRLRPGGAVVSIGSIGAERRGGSYGAAKAALGAWNAALSAELGPMGTTANVVSAGYVAGTNFFGDRMTDERHRRLVEETHTKRAGSPDDVAATIVFLASPGARHITGQTIHVDGGAFTTR